MRNFSSLVCVCYDFRTMEARVSELCKTKVFRLLPALPYLLGLSNCVRKCGTVPVGALEAPEAA